ncbi:hypothetical protein [Methanococcus maripaludis]|uniref:Uncharacterized protein n=1 Tax=Methanococcus maripaludis TaxID=39152 RepID=A0A7J9PNW9_METMI|nr:hypothetical protein [Methanococcus maripaludis]MBA2864925.1 hypothetical protein [Methanococcus maripaludis]
MKLEENYLLVNDDTGEIICGFSPAITVKKSEKSLKKIVENWNEDAGICGLGFLHEIMELKGTLKLIKVTKEEFEEYGEEMGIKKEIKVGNSVEIITRNYSEAIFYSGIWQELSGKYVVVEVNPAEEYPEGEEYRIGLHIPGCKNTIMFKDTDLKVVE